MKPEEHRMRKVTDTSKLLADLVSAAEAGRAVKIRYIREDGQVSRRSIEITAIRVTLAGDFLIEAMDRRDGDKTSFRLDRITNYTLHRAPKLADYRFLLVADPQIVIDEDLDEVTKMVFWDLEWQLAA
jgi:predicted DNA-binding transcriptional regulator YafY